MQTPTLQDVRDLAASGQLHQAVDACEALLADDPENAEAWHFSAELHLRIGRIDDAASQLMCARSIRPGDPAYDRTQLEIDCALLTDQGRRLQALGRYTEAADAYQKTAELAPDRPWPVNNMGHLHMGAGRVERAIECFRRAAFMKHPLHVAHSNLLMAMLHSDRVTPGQLLAEHKAWAARFTPRHDFAPPSIDDPNPSRRIRVGYVSPDFRNHPIANFMLPVLANHDRDLFEITCYDDSTADDAVNRMLRQTGHRWTPTAELTFESLFRRIRDDRIDILIDLAVHSDLNRLPVFAARAAPIQMTWLGYAGSTGCPAVDWRITDAIVDPPGLTDHHFTESLLRLPEIFWCFSPTLEADLTRPAVPERENGRIRVGTATRLAKVSPSCIDLWAELLRRCERADLVLSAEPFADPTIRDEWLAHFSDRGVDPDRVQLLPGGRYRQYLQFLASLDVGLDTFPFNGGTSVCQMMWMGTPVAALTGVTSVARVTTSILSAVGLQELVADSPEQWLCVNLGLIEDDARLRELHASLRQRMIHSPLCDAPRFVRDLESAFRHVFADACASVNRA